jgi:adenine-specific DNA-methyltransferase
MHTSMKSGRFTVKNLEIRYLICSNIYEWFIFDAIFFERYFAQDAAFVKKYRDFDEGRLADITTSFFYREIAAPAISAVEASIEYTYFDIRDYEKTLRSESKKEDSQLSSLFKLLSPQHLLKQPFNNESNSLDKGFYSELLHLIGLVEITEGGKQLIVRRTVVHNKSCRLSHDLRLTLLFKKCIWKRIVIRSSRRTTMCRK